MASHICVSRPRSMSTPSLRTIPTIPHISKLLKGINFLKRGHRLSQELKPGELSIRHASASRDVSSLRAFQIPVPTQPPQIRNRKPVTVLVGGRPYPRYPETRNR